MDRVIDAYRELVRLRFDDIDARKALITDALYRDDVDTVDAHLQALSVLGKRSIRSLQYISSIQQSLGRFDQAFRILDVAKKIAPEDTSVLVAEAKLFLRLGRIDASKKLLKQTLALKPQDIHARELLDTLSDEKDIKDNYILDEEDILQKRREEHGYPISVLHDLQFKRIFKNGLASSFYQLVFQVHRSQGAKELSSYAMYYDPNTQRITLDRARVYRGSSRLHAQRVSYQSLSEPWYRIYYDSRIMRVHFPPLKPGDVVELRWSVDDIAERNMFSNYFGDMTLFQGLYPILYEAYVLAYPKGRSFFIQKPKSLQHNFYYTGDARVDHYWARDVKAIEIEPNMPPVGEIAPHLHVSTYETWQQVGSWYFGLIKDQLYVDSDLQQQVSKLVVGKNSVYDKVSAIYDWVLNNTRYVALEFGIHGYQPYRIDEIVKRGFGDCKDKASLLFAMLTHAGIDAHIVLVRTREKGDLARPSPSLALFDHMIVYVPSIDRYLDGTAEYAGVDDLPFTDQGVLALHVWEGGSELRRTPVFSADRNTQRVHYTIDLDEKGVGFLKAKEYHRGAQALMFRSMLESKGMRKQRLESYLRRYFSVIQLLSLEVFSLKEKNMPLRLHYQGMMESFAKKDDSKLYVFPSHEFSFMKNWAPLSKRNHSTIIGNPFVYEETRSIRYPSNYRVSFLPTGGHVKSPYGGMSLELTVREGKVHTSLKLIIAKSEFLNENMFIFEHG